MTTVGPARSRAPHPGGPSLQGGTAPPVGAGTAGRAGDLVALLALLGGLAAALAVRLVVAGADGVRSAPAGLAFALLLGALFIGRRATASTGEGLPAARAVLFGAAGAAVLCTVPLLVHLRAPGAPLPAAGLPRWAVLVTAVAVAEEAFLRGALWQAAARFGEPAAIAVSTVAFGLLHVPLYGLGALPLDLAVGLLLGGLRMVSGGWLAPAVAHTVADLAGWWLR